MGGMMATTRQRYFRKIIRIRGDDSPNVRYARAEIKAGRKPSNTMIVPGVLSWSEFRKRRQLWDLVRQCIGLDANFWKGSSLLLYPPDWLNHGETLHEWLMSNGSRIPRVTQGIGVDTGEGEANTSITAVDWWGIIDWESVQTPDTSIIPNMVAGFAKRNGIDEENSHRIVFDRGGGGYQAACDMRAMGWEGVETVGFGEGVTLEISRGNRSITEREENVEERYTFVNRRAQMYGEASLLFDINRKRKIGSYDVSGFAIPADYTDLRHQLSLMPKLYDGEGKMRLPPKNKRSEEREIMSDGGGGGKRREKTLVELIGRSPDEADSFVLACHIMLHGSDMYSSTYAGAF